MGSIQKYDILWDADQYADPFEIEKEMVRRGGQWKSKRGTVFGKGLFYHHKAAMSILWPEDDWHRWADLFLQNIVSHTCIGAVGPASCNKTFMAAKWTLTDYWFFPNETLSVVSSTDARGLELRVWGKIKEFYNRGQDYREKNGFDPLPGQVLESFHCITTDTIDEDKKGKRARTLNKGIICIPCMSNNQYVGIGKYAGVKQKRIRLVGDEFQLMGPSHLDAYGNYMQAPGFKGIALGNISMEPTDCLKRFCEPKGGWDNFPEPTKTAVWENKWHDGVTINFVGTDSPNFDYPEDQPVRYPYMVNRVGMMKVLAFWEKESFQFNRDCLGVYRAGMVSKRFWSEDFCRSHRAHDLAIWDSAERTKLASLDAAYGGIGGDRCVFRHGEFGLSHEGKDVLRVERPEIVPVSFRHSKEFGDAEEQIAAWCFRRMMELGIPFNQLYYDSTGRGALGASFAKLMGTTPPSPVEFGGKPTQRPVRHDYFVIDEVTNERRLKRCDEQYLDMVSELWFSVKHLVHAEQMRELDVETVREASHREIGTWSKKRDFVESKHNPQHRKKMVQSPDCFVEGTLVATPTGEQPIETLKIGEVVLTPFGTSKICAVVCSETPDLCKVKFSNGRELSGKGKHQIFTKDQGWTRMDNLSLHNECVSIYDIGIWKFLNSLFTRAENTGFKHQAATIKIKTGAAYPSDFFTELFGKSILGQFQQGLKSIIKMMIGLIIPPQTWSCEPSQITCDTTCGKPFKTPAFLKPLETAWNTLANSLMLGTALRLALPFTPRTENEIGLDGKKQRPFAAFARSLLKHFSPRERNSAHSNADQLKPSFFIALIGCALCVVKNLIATGTFQRRLVPLNVDQFSVTETVKVFNLTLETENVYFANGVLVANCMDNLVTMVEGARRLGFKIENLGGKIIALTEDNWIEEEGLKWDNTIKKHLLVRSAA